MKSLKLIGLALGASFALSAGALAQDITIAVAGPMTGGESAFGRQMKNGAEQFVTDTQCRRRRARQETGAAGRRRRLRSEAGALGCGKVRQRQDPVRRRSLLLVVVDPGLRSLCRRQRAADYAGLDQPAVHRAQALERGARLRPRRSAGPGRRRLHRRRTTRARTSPSSTTRPPTAKASPTKPRSRSTRPASPKRCSNPTTRATRTLTPSSRA